MKKELEFDVKRMLNLLESKLGNVKTIIVEDSDIQDAEDIEIREEDAGTDAMTKLTRVELNYKDMGCERTPAANDALLPGESANAWGTIGSKLSKIVDDSGKSAFTSVVNANTKFVPMQCGNSMFMVTNVISPNDSNQLVVLKRNGEGANTTFQIGQKPFDGLLQRAKSYVSDERNLNADQNARVKQLIGDSGTNETGYKWFVDRPDAEDGVILVPVDLATGIAKIDGKDVQMIEKLKVDGLDPEFKRPGRYYIWAKVGTKTRSIAIPDWMEETLTSLGYTKTMPTDEIQQGAVTTLEAMCDRTGKCTEQMFQYMKTNPNAKIWPKEVSGDDIKKKQCRGVIKTLAACAKAYEKYNKLGNVSRGDAECSKAMSELGNEYASIGSYNGKILKIKNDYSVCSDQKLGLFAGQAKKDNEYLLGLGKGGNPFSPMYSAQEAVNMSKNAEKAKEDAKKGAMMEESISNSLRKVLKEHTKPNSDYMIKKSIRKNLRRLL
jgi:hypothetical protein